MEANRKKILLEKLLSNKCSREELEELLSFRGSDEFDGEFGPVFDQEWARVNDLKQMNPLRSEEIFYNIIKNTQNNESGKNKFRLNPVYKIAATLLALILFSGLFYLYISSHNFITQATAYGKTMKIMLPDGSLVTLNGNSSIKYRNSWENNEDRIINLEGEAFFKVTHKVNNQKFIVKAHGLNVEVLGTEFNVFSRKRTSSVVLKSGKVKLAMQGKEDLFMKPGQRVEVDPLSKVVIHSEVNPENYTSWKNNLLTFKSASLSEISTMVLETYGLKIEIDDPSLKEERFTGTFPANEDINVLLMMLSKTYNFEIVKEEDKIILKK